MDTVRTKDELAVRLGLSVTTLWRIENRNPLNPPPEMNEAGGFDVEEWRAWLDGIKADSESSEERELLSVRIATENERFRALRFKNDLAEGKFVKRERATEFAKLMIMRVREYVDDLNEKASILFAGDAEKLEQLRTICADVELQMEDDFAKLASARDSADI